MINPMQMIQAIRNPQAFMNQIMGNQQMMSNPMVRNAMNMYKNGDKHGLQTMAENLAKERGTTIEDVKNNLMNQFGMK